MLVTKVGSFNSYLYRMKVEEAVVYLLSTEGRGMSTEALAHEINVRGLHLRGDGLPVTSAQVYACVMRYKEMFCKDGRLIRLTI